MSVRAIAELSPSTLDEIAEEVIQPAAYLTEIQSNNFPFTGFQVMVFQQISATLLTMLTTLKYTAIALALCWLPLLIVGGLGISDNPVGLGILAVVVSPIILVVAAIILVFQLVKALSAGRR